MTIAVYFICRILLLMCRILDKADHAPVTISKLEEDLEKARGKRIYYHTLDY